MCANLVCLCCRYRSLWGYDSPYNALLLVWVSCQCTENGFHTVVVCNSRHLIFNRRTIFLHINFLSFRHVLVFAYQHWSLVWRKIILLVGVHCSVRSSFIWTIILWEKLNWTVNSILSRSVWTRIVVVDLAVISRIADLFRTCIMTRDLAVKKSFDYRRGKIDLRWFDRCRWSRSLILTFRS